MKAADKQNDTMNGNKRALEHDDSASADASPAQEKKKKKDNNNKKQKVKKADLVENKGAYGQVRFEGERAFKSGDLFLSSDDALVTCNLNEAINVTRLATYCQMPVYQKVEVTTTDAGAHICTITMVRGKMDLETYIKTMPADRRARAAIIRHALPQLAEQLVIIHGHGLSHGDVKPANIIVLDSAREEMPDVQLVDLGSGRMYDRHPRALEDVITHAYAAPELFEGVSTGPAGDAYALGAVMYEMLVGKVPLEMPKRTKGDEKRYYRDLHREGKIDAHVAQLEQFEDPEDQKVVHQIAALLAHDPAKRLSVNDLHSDLKGYTLIIDPERLIIEAEAYEGGAQRDRVIDAIFGWPGVKEVGVATLACSIADRFMAKLATLAEGKEGGGGSSPLAEGKERFLVEACVGIAKSLVMLDADFYVCESAKAMLVDVMRTLECKIFSETCDTLLRSKDPALPIDFGMIQQAVKAKRGTLDAVEHYKGLCAEQKRKRGFVVILDD